jgi:hypothetical protein
MTRIWGASQEHTQLNVNKHSTCACDVSFLLFLSPDDATTMKKNLKDARRIWHRYNRRTMLSLFSSRYRKVATSLFITCALSSSTSSVSGFIRPTTNTLSKHSKDSSSSLNMAEHNPHLTDHNFSGPRVEKQDPGLPTMIVFDLDGKSLSRHEYLSGIVLFAGTKEGNF